MIYTRGFELGMQRWNFFEGHQSENKINQRMALIKGVYQSLLPLANGLQNNKRHLPF